jgi:hypothetical protein
LEVPVIERAHIDFAALLKLHGSNAHGEGARPRAACMDLILQVKYFSAAMV